MGGTAKYFPFHFESDAVLNSAAEAIFSHLDDYSRLSAHMTQASWMMAGGRMRLKMDESQGRAAGSRIRLRGRVLGIPLEVEEVVTDYLSPLHKRWETIGTPKLLVIGHYRMGFEIMLQGNISHLRIFIDYALPESLPAHWLGRIFGGRYARWCTQRMIGDVEKYFHPG